MFPHRYKPKASWENPKLLSRGVEGEHWRARMLLNKREDGAEIMSRLGRKTLSGNRRRTDAGRLFFKSSSPSLPSQCASLDSMQDQIAQFPLLSSKHRQGFPLLAYLFLYGSWRGGDDRKGAGWESRGLFVCVCSVWVCDNALHYLTGSSVIYWEILRWLTDSLLHASLLLWCSTSAWWQAVQKSQVIPLISQIYYSIPPVECTHMETQSRLQSHWFCFFKQTCSHSIFMQAATQVPDQEHQWGQGENS